MHASFKVVCVSRSKKLHTMIDYIFIVGSCNFIMGSCNFISLIRLMKYLFPLSPFLYTMAHWHVCIIFFFRNTLLLPFFRSLRHFSRVKQCSTTTLIETLQWWCFVVMMKFIQKDKLAFGGAVRPWLNRFHILVQSLACSGSGNIVSERVVPDRSVLFCVQTWSLD